ncbi:MAG: TlyA family RNA methyltransferase [Pseudomonadota bacterium]
MAKSSAKQRADVLVVARNLAETRARAQALILAGKVIANDQRVEKPGQQLPADAQLRLKGPDHPWVSRGGLKLAHALEVTGWSMEGARVLDIGASTGGFTDVSLDQGASKVWAVDVGHGQLHWRLQNHERVTVLDKTNARFLDDRQLGLSNTSIENQRPNWLICDASFISLKTVLPAPLACLTPDAQVITLIKPQFEVGREALGKGGVVRDRALHDAVCRDIGHWFTCEMGWRVTHLIESPIQGPQGNREFLLCGRCGTF